MWSFITGISHTLTFSMFIHTVAWISASLFYTAKQNYLVWTFHTLPVHPLMNFGNCEYCCLEMILDLLIYLAGLKESQHVRTPHVSPVPLGPMSLGGPLYCPLLPHWSLAEPVSISSSQSLSSPTLCKAHPTSLHFRVLSCFLSLSQPSQFLMRLLLFFNVCLIHSFMFLKDRRPCLFTKELFSAQISLSAAYKCSINIWYWR